MYTIDEIVTTSRVDERGKLKFFAAMQMMQDCSELWQGSEPTWNKFFRENHRAQLLASRQVEIYRVPDYGEKLSISTWVYSCRATFGLRSTAIRDEKGEVCYASDSMGAFISLDTAQLKKLPQEVLDSVTFEEKLPMVEKSRKILVPEGDVTLLDPYRVKRSDIDYNHHMNNSHYVRLAMEALPADFEPKGLRVEHKIPMRLDEELQIKLTTVPDAYYLTFLCERGISAVMEFT